MNIVYYSSSTIVSLEQGNFWNSGLDRKPTNCEKILATSYRFINWIHCYIFCIVSFAYRTECQMVQSEWPLPCTARRAIECYRLHRHMSQWHHYHHIVQLTEPTVGVVTSSTEYNLTESTSLFIVACYIQSENKYTLLSEQDPTITPWINLA